MKHAVAGELGDVEFVHAEGYGVVENLVERLLG
jgi:hypothetical protein